MVHSVPQITTGRLLPATDDWLPEAFRERLGAMLTPEGYARIVAAFSQPAATGFRINTLLASRDEVIARLAEEGIQPHAVSWKDDAFYVEPEMRGRLLASTPYLRNHLYIQNLSSMIPPLLLDARPDERVLDLAAAPGSKTLQIACAMGGSGELAAVELVKGRFFKLRDNLKTQGAHTVRTFLKNGEGVWKNRPEYFDRVLLDAPCSTEGRFSKLDPDTTAYWSPRKIKEMARKQHRLFYSAVQSLRPGGVLVYSTCTFAPEENEAVIDDALARFGDAIEVESPPLALPNMEPGLPEWRGRSFRAAVSNTRRVLPDAVMEGFFVALLRKRRSTL